VECEGIDPSVRERAEAAARRAGMSLSDWLNSTIGDFGSAKLSRNLVNRRHSRPGRPDVADIHQRLDALPPDREIARPARAATRPATTRCAASRRRQTIERPIFRLDARLSQISDPAPARQSSFRTSKRQATCRARGAQVYRALLPSAGVLDVGSQRSPRSQSELDNPMPRPLREQRTAGGARNADGAGFFRARAPSRQDHQPIEALQRPDGIEQSIATFRGE